MIPPRVFRVFVFAILAIVLSSANSLTFAVEEPYWPQFHGPKSDNISADTGLLKEWPEGGPEMAWKVTGIGDGYATVTIADGRIFTAGNIDDKMVITAMDLAGNILWRANNGSAYTKSFPGSRGTPTIDGSFVYHENPLGDVICLEAATGKEKWSVNILDKFGSKNIIWALAESVLIDGPNIICLPGGPQASIVALSKQTGRTVWKSEPTDDLAGYATGIIVEHEGIRMILAMTGKALIGVDADSGRLLFRYEFITKYDVNATTPIFLDGQVFISGGYGNGSAMVQLNVDGGNVTATRVWESKELDNHHGGVILWDGYLYGAAHNFNRGSWICLDWKTGEMQYAEKGVGKGSATLADGLLYTYSEKRNVGLVAPTPEGHELISEFEIPSEGKGPTWAHPVVCGGRLYLRHGDVLYVYDVKAK